MAAHRNFTELAHERITALAEREAYVCVRDDQQGGLESDVLSYGELGESARRLASWLQRSGSHGHRVLILQSDVRQFMSSFLGCLYAGAVAVPAPVPAGSRQNVERVAGIVRDASVSYILTDAAMASAVSQLLAEMGHTEVATLATDRFSGGDPDAWEEPGLFPDDVAFLQYTSGSVSDPKGVMVTHRNLLANQQSIQRAMRTSQESRVGGWLPFHHDMGLVGHLLHPLWLGACGVLMPPMTFVKRPLRWLQMVDRHGITTGGGPNLAYDLCLRRIKDDQIAELDLSRWETAVNGAEPVRAETMEAFAERFAPAGFRREAFYPCYGLAEATLLATGGDVGEPAAMRLVDAGELEQHRLRPAELGQPERRLVSCGRPQGCEVAVVDPDTGRRLPAGQVGEVWLRGESIARGYWNRPLENAHAFHAVTEDGDEGYLRTGDLGALAGGELYVTGRIKDIMIVAGRNLYPQDIERSVQRISALFGSSAAFAVESGRDHVVVVQEVRTGSCFEAELAQLSAAVRTCVAQEFEVAAENVLLVRPGTVRRTTSGKLQRTAMRRLFLDGRIQPLYEELHPEVRALVTTGAMSGEGATSGGAAG
ncbi:fatty acyl-AMP ligase [Streptomyces sp. HNM0663]|uniref:Fatty acyl-AMP ligase n=1 Tax=Streptomyces chengmaiensis TaxID=3040919 RepID=A0ABT6HQ76_9ACTN|nr:fatty acyl-AMP ligase [Streptomyces chengmaiensis]MDH2390770.1 fatty acyl-AMP ligase [Streptomyces chengmaiensis]